MIVSAVSLWKKFNLTTPLSASEWGIEDKEGVRTSHVSYFGHTMEDGSVRIYARFMRPITTQKTPVVLLLNDAGKSADDNLMHYFVDKGYAVLCPDYSGKTEADGEDVFRTIYPNSLEYGNLQKARGLKETAGYEVD